MNPSFDVTGPPAGAEPVRPRSPLRRKLVLWSVALVALPTLVSAVWLNSMTRRALADNHARHVTKTAQTLAAVLADHMDEAWDGAPPRAIAGFESDPSVAFIRVTDLTGRVIYLRTNDPGAWLVYQDFAPDTGQVGGVRPITQANVPIRLTTDGDLVACRMPIWLTPGDSDSDTLTDNQAELSGQPLLGGFLLLALTDPTMPTMLTQLYVSQLAAACLVALLCVPLSVMAVRRLTAPVMALAAAAVRFGGQHQSPPVPIQSDDEIGLLARAFNRMMRRLGDARLQLIAANVELEQKVTARTAELQQAKADLEAQVRDKDEFLRAVSHDLGAPLRNIDGLATMLLLKHRDALAEDAQRKLERIGANVKAQIELIDDLLELSRIRTSPRQPKPVDLGDVVAELRDSLSYDLERRGIRFEVRGELPVVVAERNRMRQLFQNLIDNAVKYMPPGGGRIAVSCRSTTRAHQLSISDTGGGISEADLPRIFEVFRRCNRNGPDDATGRGVGLATVKSIVERLGGRVWAESEVGRGSTFHFTLDRAIVDQPCEDVAPPSADRTPQSETV